MAFDLSKFTAKFVEEAREHIRQMNEGLVRLEKNPEDAENLHAIFRAAHTIKGSSRMLRLNRVSEVAHKLEDALGALREQNIGASQELCTLFFRSADVLADLVEHIAEGKERTEDNHEICEALEQAARGMLSVPETPPQAPADLERQPQPPEPEAHQVSDARQPPALEAQARPDQTIRISVDTLDELIKLMEELVSRHNQLEQRIVDVRQIERSAKQQLDTLSRLETHALAPHGYQDSMMHTAQGLHLGLIQLATRMKDESNLQKHLTQELQEKALRMRMLPLATVFETFPRTVRDIAVSLEKDVDLIVDGKETELDKKIIEKLQAPLLHMIRNAIDHGIEPPAERVQQGKPARGTIHLSASYREGSVVLEVRDDGTGISEHIIREKALRMRLFDVDTLNAMSRSDVIDLIFHPGFSTSTMITDVSGRGVGMDVVRKNIVEELKGAIRVDTREGQGTTFALQLPPTLAIMHVLLFDVAGRLFGIAAHAITEILRVPHTALIDVIGRQAIKLRDQLVPLVNLETLLQLPQPVQVEAEDDQSDIQELLILLVHTSGEQLGLIIDALFDEGNVVIKPLPSHMSNLQWVSGVTITGKNDLVNILHTPMLLKAAKEMQDLASGMPEVPPATKELHILVVDDSVSTREIEKSILEAYGYRVSLAYEGMDALEKAKAFHYDLIITDIEMPHLDGFTLTQKLRADPAYKDTPIIIVTSRAQEEDKRKGRQIGANAYITKGAFDQSNLLETVQALIG